MPGPWSARREFTCSAPDDCLPLGPSAYLTQTAAEGIPYPILPLPAYSPDKSLNDIPYQYFKVTDAGASLYSSLDAAAANQPSKILYPSNDLYVSYQGSAVTGWKGILLPTAFGLLDTCRGRSPGQIRPTLPGTSFQLPAAQLFRMGAGHSQIPHRPRLEQPGDGQHLVPVQCCPDLCHPEGGWHHLGSGCTQRVAGCR